MSDEGGIFRLWAAGRSPREIADETKVAVEQVYRILKKLQKRLRDEPAKEEGVENYGERIHI